MRQTTRAVRAVAVLVAGGVLVVGGCDKPKPVATTAPQPAAATPAPAYDLAGFRSHCDAVAAVMKAGEERMAAVFKSSSPGQEITTSAKCLSADFVKTDSLTHPVVARATFRSGQTSTDHATGFASDLGTKYIIDFEPAAPWKPITGTKATSSRSFSSSPANDVDVADQSVELSADQLADLTSTVPR